MASIEEGLGFIPEVVNSAIQNINSAYEGYAQNIGSGLQGGFIDFCSQNWFSQNAQKFFTSSVEPAVNELKAEVDKVFQSVSESMNTAGTGWSAKTGNQFQTCEMTISPEKIDSSVIQNTGPAGFVGIMPNTEATAQAELTKIMQMVQQNLENAAKAVASPDVSGFSGGGGQAENLASSLRTIQQNINDKTQELSNQLHTYLQQEETASEELAQKIASAFAGN